MDSGGIQASTRLNERTVGTALGSPLRPTQQPKKVCAEKSPKKNLEKIKVYLQPSSIPTKFQTIHYDDSEDYGFNSTAQRFSTKMVLINFTSGMMMGKAYSLFWTN